MSLGQIRGNLQVGTTQKSKKIKIGFDTSILLIFLMKKHPFLGFLKSWIEKHLAFVPSEAPLSINFQNWKKSVSLNDSLPKEYPNFGCLA